MARTLAAATTAAATALLVLVVAQPAAALDPVLTFAVSANVAEVFQLFQHESEVSSTVVGQIANPGFTKLAGSILRARGLKPIADVQRLFWSWGNATLDHGGGLLTPEQRQLRATQLRAVIDQVHPTTNEVHQVHVAFEHGAGECLYALLETSPVPGNDREVAYTWGFARGQFALGSDYIVVRDVHRRVGIGGGKTRVTDRLMAVGPRAVTDQDFASFRSVMTSVFATAALPEFPTH